MFENIRKDRVDFFLFKYVFTCKFKRILKEEIGFEILAAKLIVLYKNEISILTFIRILRVILWVHISFLVPMKKIFYRLFYLENNFWMGIKFSFVRRLCRIYDSTSILNCVNVVECWNRWRYLPVRAVAPDLNILLFAVRRTANNPW